MDQKKNLKQQFTESTVYVHTFSFITKPLLLIKSRGFVFDLV
jgi:hypothetical protein